ncbi:MAG: cytochrome C, partial [Nitrospirota bacterium]
MMMWLLPAILGMTTLLSCSGESAQVKTEEPREAQLSSVAIEFAPPSPENIPGTQLGEQIRLGYEIVVNTQEYAKAYVGNRLNCTNCHLDAGLNPNAASFVGLAAVYPEYRARNARVNTLVDRVNECFERSLIGRALPPGSSKLQAVVAYITWLSHGVP